MSKCYWNKCSMSVLSTSKYAFISSLWILSFQSKPQLHFFFFYFKYFTRSGRPLEGCESLGYSPRNRSSNLELSRTLAFWHVEFLLCLLNAWQKNKREKKKQLYFSFGFPQDFDFISSLALAIFYCNLSVYMSVLSPRLCTPWRQAVSLRHSFSWAPSTC